MRFAIDRVPLFLLACIVSGCGGGGGNDGTVLVSDVTSDPVTSDPVTSDPITSDPITNDSFGLDVRPSSLDCLPLQRPSTGSGVRLEKAFPNLPLLGVAIIQAPEPDSHWFLLHRDGTIHTFPNDPDVSEANVFLNIKDRVLKFGEGGLTGLTLHPDFASNGLAFVSYTGPGDPMISYISRFASTDGGDTLDPDSEEILFDIPIHNRWHIGGRLAFGPDGYLYIGVGDTSKSPLAQNTDALAGSFLRINIDSGSPYAIPPDNPFVSGGGRPEIYAWGFRNPWGWSFDRVTDELWVGDVGGETREEVNRIQLGGNYGWNKLEGTLCHKPESCDNPDIIEPVFEYPHSDGRCIIGGHVYRGSALPTLYGTYIFGDWSFGKIMGLFHDDDGKPFAKTLIDVGSRVLSFAEDHEGELYVWVDNSAIFKLVPDADTEPDTFPKLLSELPCVNPMEPSKPGPGLIPYDINVPFWSDNAVKERWLALPDGETIHILDDGDWEFPIGSLLLKHFRVNDKLVESRVLIRHDDSGWGGYSYEWNDAQTDAALLRGAKVVEIEGQSWTFPSRGQCFQCHTGGAGEALGPETSQMNRSFNYPTTGRTANQLATFEHIGLFDSPLPDRPYRLPVLPDPYDPAESLENRARAYLHVNCSNCHRPDNPIGTVMDFRFETPTALIRACNAIPTQGDLGIPDAHVLVPGEPGLSILSRRMHAVDTKRMPPIGKAIVDVLGTDLIDAWIAAMPDCE